METDQTARPDSQLAPLTSLPVLRPIQPTIRNACSNNPFKCLVPTREASTIASGHLQAAGSLAA